MKKIASLIVVCSLIILETHAKPPKISGNYEQGSRYAIDYDEIEYPTFWFEEVEEDIDQETWAYNFEKGYLQLSQQINKDIRYTVKYDYIYKDYFAANINNKNRLNYYRTYSWLYSVIEN